MNSYDNGESMFEIIFLQSDDVQEIERDVFTIMDALTQTGGIISIVYTVLQFIANSVEYFLYMRSIISKVFWVTKYNLPKKERAEMKPKQINSKQMTMRAHKVKKDVIHQADIYIINDVSNTTISE